MTSIIDLLVTTGKWQMMHMLLDDDLGRVTVKRLRPWYRLLARCLAPRLDRQLAEGARPEENAVLVFFFKQKTAYEFDIGANDMSAHIQSMMNGCPDTRLVL